MTGGAVARRTASLLAGLALFIVLATLNSAGYRFGASDQAFYVPAVVHRLHPDYYPRDGALIESQARLTIGDEAIATAAGLMGAPLPALFAALYAATLVLLALAGLRLGRIYHRTSWAAVALTAALTLRHGIALTGTNTLEGYFHPRQLAFAFGAWGLVALLGGRTSWAMLAVAAAAVVHPTTAVWFALWISVAAVVADRRLVVPALAAGAGGAIAAAWLLTSGPLAGRLQTMDPEWLATLADRRYLFPLEWPWTIWLLNLSYPIVIVWLYRRRRAAALVTRRETGVVAGALALLGVFLVSLPFAAGRVAIVIQLQPARVFWMLDFLAVIYVIWGLAEGARAAGARARLVAVVVGLLALGRGLYIAGIEFPDRSMFAIGLPDSDWGRVMRWARESSPASSHWLASPDHALRYGTSVRVAGERDVFVEMGKDAAIGMYDRPVAMRTRDRLAAIADFNALTSARARALAREYDIDFLVTEEPLDLPVAFASGPLRVYRFE